MLGEINIDWTLLYMEYFTLQKVICLVSFLQAEMNKKILTTETLGDRSYQVCDGTGFTIFTNEFSFH